MSATYYTPEISEMHVGLICQHRCYVRGALSEWVEQWTNKIISIYDFDPESYKKIDEQSMDNFRVKHLDREDIEGEGWEYDNNEEPIPPLRNYPYEMPIAFCYEEGLNQYLLYKYKDGLIAIEHVLDCSGEGYIFKGFILNLSEFRKLMKQLNIKKP
jgi:hypothetical protein